MERIKFTDYEIGDNIPQLEARTITHLDLVRYAGASGDFNPIHTDPDFAKSAGLEDGTIAHGMFGMAQLGRLLNNWVHPSQVRSFKVKFKNMVPVGSSLLCKAKIKRKKEEEANKLLILSLEALVGEDICISGEAEILCD